MSTDTDFPKRSYPCERNSAHILCPGRPDTPEEPQHVVAAPVRWIPFKISLRFCYRPMWSCRQGPRFPTGRRPMSPATGFCKLSVDFEEQRPYEVDVGLGECPGA